VRLGMYEYIIMGCHFFGLQDNDMTAIWVIFLVDLIFFIA
jgi:hypothetical protein